MSAPRYPQGVRPADLDRAAQIAPHRYVDGMEAFTAHVLETEHFRYEATRPGYRGAAVLNAREPALTVTLYPVSECARFYLEGEGGHYRRGKVHTAEFAAYVGHVGRALAGYWGPALSTAR